MSLDDFLEPPALVLDKDGTHRPAYVTITQPDGSALHIQTHDVSDATKLLGSLFTPVGDSSARVDEMLGKGYTWVDALVMKPMSRQDFG